MLTGQPLEYLVEVPASINPDSGEIVFRTPTEEMGCDSLYSDFLRGRRLSDFRFSVCFWHE